MAEVRLHCMITAILHKQIWKVMAGFLAHCCGSLLLQTCACLNSNLHREHMNVWPKIFQSVPSITYLLECAKSIKVTKAYLDLLIWDTHLLQPQCLHVSIHISLLYWLVLFLNHTLKATSVGSNFTFQRFNWSLSLPLRVGQLCSVSYPPIIELPFKTTNLHTCCKYEYDAVIMIYLTICH